MAIAELKRARSFGHRPDCKSGKNGPEWSGSPNPDNPDDEWICDECCGVIPTGAPTYYTLDGREEIFAWSEDGVRVYTITSTAKTHLYALGFKL